MTTLKQLEDKMPRGSGFLKMHHGSWWIGYRTDEGKQIADNTFCTDRLDAVRVQALHAIDRLQERIRTLREIAHEAKAAKTARTAGASKGEDQLGAGNAGKPGSRNRSGGVSAESRP